MKINIALVLVLFSTNYCLSQLKVVSGEVLYISGAQNLYTNETIYNDGAITLGTGKLYIARDVHNNNLVSLSNGTVALTGANTQTFDFANEDIAKRVELDKSAGTATFNSGSLVITDGLLSLQGAIDGGGKLIMRSTATKTAIVEQSSGGTIDNIVVERYIPAKRAFRFLSSPVTTSTSIKSNWQENQNNTATAYTSNSNIAPGYGTHITGSTTGVNGFDATQTGAASLFQFNNTTQSWSAISNTNTNTLTVGNPYRLMVRGSRAVNLTNNAATPSSTTLRTKGSLKIGSFTNSNLSAVSNEYNFIGNPYQAPIDMAAILNTSTNINPNFYYVWDPKVGGTNGRGAYVTYTFTGNTNNVSGSAVNQYLQPMQSCFVKTLANGAANITFNESNKYTAATNENIYKTAQSLTNTASLRLTLYETNAFNEQQTPADGVLLYFDDSFSNAVDAFDAEKMTNLDENISVLSQTNKLSIANFQFPLLSTVYPLNIDQYRYTNYNLVAQLDNYSGLTPYLYDKFMQVYSEINPDVNYSFTVDATIAASTANNRFEIVYSNPNLTNQNFTTESVSLYPNPSTSNDFNLQLPSEAGEYKVTVYNILGQLINIITIESGRNTLNCTVEATAAAGIYHVVITKDNLTVIKKWIKE
jgi:hypothetical protein